MKICPFIDGNALAAFPNIIDKECREIKSLENEYVLKASQTELEDYYIDKVTIQPLILYHEQHYIEKKSKIQRDVSGEYGRVVLPGQRGFVPGTRMDIAIPYEGNPELWRIGASAFNSGDYPEIEVRADTIVFSISFPDDSAVAEELKSKINKHINSLADAVQNLNRDIDNHNRTAPQAIRSAIQSKRQLAESAVGAVSALGIPMKRRDEPLTYVAPTKRRQSPVRRPKVATEKYKPEPVLEEAEYKHILEVMRSMSMVIERDPNAFTTLGEEDIRTHFLLQLNGHYEGSATGETFNASGKTDILIRIEDKNIFIAECKFWKGPKSFNDAIDQLLGYLSWRDSKCALLMFNKTKDSSSVRQKMHEVMQSRPEHRRTISHDLLDDSRYVFVKESDPGRDIIITTQLYDFPVGG